MKNLRTKVLSAVLAVSVLGASAVAFTGCGNKDTTNDSKVTLTNVSYDPTRELYESYNKIFAKHWKEETGQDIEVTQSHGGSGKQALEVANGLEADVVTLALEYDVNAIRDAGLIEDGWVNEFDNDSSPYTSTIVFLVRKGNPKNIKDWDDVAKDGVGVITPNPKTSGGARWNYLAAWGYALEKYGSEEKAREFVAKLFANVPVLDSGARGSTNTFVQRGLGDVLLAWENEAFLAVREQPGKFEIITPSLSILAEPSVAIVDKTVDKDGNRNLAKGYLNFLYSPLGQEIAAKNFYRPRNQAVLKKYAQVFKPLKLVTIDQEFGGWKKVQKQHFENDGIFDQIVKQNNAK